MKNNLKKAIGTLLVLTAILFSSCKKEDTVKVADQKYHFVFKSNATLQVLPTSKTYKLAVGATNTTGADRTVGISVTSPTGAVAGTHYNLNKTSATIKAGQAIDTIEITGVETAYNTGRKDTLVFTITDPASNGIGTNTTFTLALRGPCFEGSTDLATLNSLIGSYPNTNELFGTSAYGPYTTSVSAVTLTSPTTGTVTINNIWDNGWGPITFNLDWSNPANPTTAVVPQAAIPGSNAGDLSATYAGQTVAVRALASNPTGTFSACNSTFTLRMQLGVTGVGFFGSLYQVTVRK